MNTKKLLILASLLLSGCVFEKITDESRPPSLQILTLQDIDSPVEVIEEGSFAAPKKIKLDNEFTLKARVKSPVMNGIRLQANSVDFKGGLAVVAYNIAGDQFGGAIQIFTFKKKKITKRLVEALFPNMDIQALAIQGNRLYIGGHANDALFESRSFITYINVKTNQESKLISDFNSHIKFFPLGYGVTSLYSADNLIWASIGGENGGSLKLNSKLDSLNFDPQDDLRQTTHKYNYGVSITGNINGDAQLIRVDNNETLYTFETETADEHRNDLEFHSGYFYAARADAGLDVIRGSQPSLSYHIDNPNSSVKSYSNGVTRDGKHIFVANGEYGIRYLKINLSKNTHQLLGYIPFEGLQISNQNYSANGLRYKKDHLVVAAGVGGALIYRLPN